MHRSTIAIAAVVIVAGCARREAPAPSTAPRPPADTEAPDRTLPAPQAYVATASSIDQLIIRSADRAQVRARDARLRDFAAQVKRDHEAIAAQLSFAGRRLNQLPSGRLTDNHAARLAALEASSDFDGAYRREMARSLAAAYEYHSRYAARGDSPTLRPVARFAAETIARNAERLRSL